VYEIRGPKYSETQAKSVYYTKLSMTQTLPLAASRKGTTKHKTVSRRPWAFGFLLNVAAGPWPLLAVRYDETISNPHGSADKSPGEAQFDRMQSHPRYVLVDLKSYKEVRSYADMRMLGEGHNGYVYLAKERKSQRLVVLKVPKQMTPADLSLMSQACSTLQEVHSVISKGATGLSSSGPKHVMTCIEADIAFNPPFVALENAGADPLRLLYYQDASFVLALMKQVFYALASFYTSRPPMVHHDLKWGNTGYDSSSGCLRLIDLDESQWATPFQAKGSYLAIPGTYRISHTQGMAPPEFVVHKNNFACDDTDLDDKGVEFCKFGFSFDAYSAGIMLASTLCGVAEHSASEYVAKQVVPHLKHYKLQVVGKDVWALLSMAGVQEKQLYKNGLMWAAGKGLTTAKMKDQVATLRRDAGTVKDSDPWYSAFHAKLEYCEQLIAGGKVLDLVDKLRDQSPKVRPSPLRVLQHPLFKDVSTGCGWDE